MRVLFLCSILILPLFASVTEYKNLKLNSAIKILKEKNIEVDVASMDVKIKSLEHFLAKSYNYGKLDFIHTALYSNDSGKVFGFKLESREATFGDFGFSEFNSANSNILSVQPKELNYPDARAHFQTKFTYQLPIYTGGKLEQYGKITASLKKLALLDKEKILFEKIFQLKKSYYDIYLLNTYTKNLKVISKNMQKLENMVQNMLEEGYAKRIDILEVQAKKANVDRMIKKSEANRELVYHFISFLLNSKVKSIISNKTLMKSPTCNSEEILNNNIDIKKAKEGLDITLMSIQLEKSSYLPTLGAFAEYQMADDEIVTSNNSYTVGLQLKWNIFSGGASSYGVEKARVENLKVQKQLNLAKQGIILQVKKILTEIKSFDFDIESLEKEINLTRSIYKNYLGRYQEKVVSINDVIIKQSLEIEKVLELNRVQNQRSSKILELEKIAGEEI